jgi:hypothetical protein
MTQRPILAPIELTDAELDAVSGGHHTSVAVGIAQSNQQNASIAQLISIGGGNGVPNVEIFVDVIIQVANNTNVGNVSTQGLKRKGS